MRFVPVLIIIIVLAFLPSILYARHILKEKKSVTGGIVAAYAIPTILILAFVLIQFSAKVGIIDFRLMEWTLWFFMLLILPSNTYSFFYIIYKAIKLFTKKSYRVLHYIGAIAATIVMLGLIVGVATRHYIQIREVTITSSNLPKEFDGIKIAHITDLHLGNLSPRDKYLKKITRKLEEQQPDMLVFTGDMMNLTAEEATKHIGLFSQINAPLGQFAVMGNHDYGDYSKWESEELKIANIKATHKAYNDLGFTLLNDSALHIYKDSAYIGIIGVENWSKPPFPRYGDLNKATKDFNPAQFNILLSHDPNHWKYEVTNNEYKYIDLTLSGHTHSAQFGLNITDSVKWSPSQWIFEYWDGLYHQENQHLFISRGLGYVGIPFRLGMPAEISIIKLKKQN